MNEAELSAGNQTEFENSDLEDAFVLDIVEVFEDDVSDSSNLSYTICQKDPLADCDPVGKSSNHALSEVNHRKRRDNFSKNTDEITDQVSAKKYIKLNQRVAVKEHSQAKKRKKDNVSFPCKTCNIDFKQKYKYDVHVKTIHNSSKSETCKENTFTHPRIVLNFVHLKKKFDQLFEQTLRSTSVKHPAVLPHNLRSQRLRQNYLKNVLHSVTKPSSGNVSESSAISSEHGMRFLCTECGSEFRKRSTLENHSKKMHKKSNQELRENVTKFECAECGNRFTKRYNLIIHLRSIHKQTFIKSGSEKRFACYICEKGFSQNYNLKVHLNTIHKITDFTPKKEKPFICSVCEKQFRRKHTLKIHSTSIHGLELEPKKEKKFTYQEKIFNFFPDDIMQRCPTCQKLFSRKPNLLRHSLMKHPESPDLKCLTCGKKFLTEEEIRDHVKMCSHKQALQMLKSERIKNKVIQQTVVCALCKLTLHKVADMRRHYQNDHHLDMSFACLIFPCEEEFLAWKYEEETNARCSFSRYRSYKIQKSKYVDFFCSRSGFYKDKNHGLRGRRFIGSKKINACCPAQIKVKYLNDEITVKYLRTHVGHDNKLCYMNLTKMERELIIEELRKGIAPQKILEKIKHPLPTSEDERRKIHLLTVQDIRNIAVTNGIKYKKGRYREEKAVDNVSTWVEKHPDSVLYYKAREQLDEAFPSLKKEDFILIIMTEKQRIKLENLGNNVILVDSTNRSEKNDYILTTLMVLDCNDESFPCCFMFSSRINDEFLNIFYESIRKNIFISVHSSKETLKTKTFISGMQDYYYSSWIEVFPVPEFRLFCHWHVLKNWRDNLNKITLNNAAINAGTVGTDDLRKLKNEVYKFLKFDLMEQRDLQTFHNEVNSFLEIDNPVLRYFQTFFKNTYFLKKEMWAFCYREMAGIKPHSFTESFEKVLKYQHSDGNKVRQLDQALAAVVSFLEKKTEAEILREEKGVQDLQKLRTLRRRHSNSLKGNTFSISSLSPNEWIVPSPSSKFGDELCESYYIRRRDNSCVNCYLMCRQCGVCAHEFECTCTDYCVFNNMCKHIHLLCQSKEILSSNITQMNDPLASDSIEEVEEVIFDFEPENEEVEYEIINAADFEIMQNEKVMDALSIKEDDLTDELTQKDVTEIIASEEECTEVKEQFNKVITGISSSSPMLNVAKKWVEQFTSIITACEKQNHPDASSSNDDEEKLEVVT